MEFTRNGFIEVICGPLFAGKSEEVIRRIKRLEYAKKKVLIFKPTIDNRYSNDEIVSHDKRCVKSINIEKGSDIRPYLRDDLDAVVIDEVQFLDEEVISIADELANKGIRVILAGLDMDFRGEPFKIMDKLLCKAEFITK